MSTIPRGMNGQSLLSSKGLQVTMADTCTTGPDLPLTYFGDNHTDVNRDLLV